MFESTLTQGGYLSRLRLVGGRVSLLQLEGILDWIKEGELEITRRGNLQHRSVVPPSLSVLEHLQKLNLIGNAKTDRLRNIMLSPMAGIDSRAVLNPIPLAKAWENFLNSHGELHQLSAKFSVGFDGGEVLTINALLNDVLVNAKDNSHCLLYLTEAVGIIVEVRDVILVIATIVFMYLSFSNQSGERPRLKTMIASLGIEQVWQRLEEKLDRKFSRCQRGQAEKTTSFLGVFPQKEPCYNAISVAVPLGRLSAFLLRELLQIIDRYGGNELRFTPWQGVLIPFVHQSKLEECLTTIDRLGLSYRPSLPTTACSGRACNSSFTDTQADAQRLTDRSVNIHISGCPKLCAQSMPHDFVAIGIKPGIYALYQQQKKIAECTGPELLTHLTQKSETLS